MDFLDRPVDDAPWATNLRRPKTSPGSKTRLTRTRRKRQRLPRRRRPHLGLARRGASAGQAASKGSGRFLLRGRALHQLHHGVELQGEAAAAPGDQSDLRALLLQAAAQEQESGLEVVL